MRFTASRVAATVGLQQNPRKSELVGNRTALWAGIHPSTFFSVCCFAISFQVHWLFLLRRLRDSLQKWTPTYLTRGTRFRTTADISQQTQKLEQRLMLTSELTEILQFDSLTLTANDVLEIEIGGPVPGNPADVNDNDIDGFDQIIVTGTDGVHLGGLLDVHLVNDYLPAIGTSFRFLSMPSAASLTGRFSNAFGLYAFPSNDRYFDVIVDNVNKELRLEVKALPGGLQFSPPDSQRDAFGRFLSSYFDVSSPTFSCDGSISVAGFATISGTLAFEQSAGVREKLWS